jgi:hypothetical protein
MAKGKPMPEAKAPGPPRFDPALETKLAGYYMAATGKRPRREVLSPSELLTVKEYLNKRWKALTN